MPTSFTEPKLHYVNLDLPPRERWIDIAKEYKQDLRALNKYLTKKQGEEVACCAPLVVGVMAWGTKNLFAPTEFMEELEGIASVTEEVDLDFNKLLSFNIGYNFLAHCTSISTNKDPNGTATQDSASSGPYHLRNMDWDAEVLKALCTITIDVIFQKSGKDVFRMTTWAGMVGCLTGMRLRDPSDDTTGWSVSLNFRKTNEFMGMVRNIVAGMVKYDAIDFLLRKTLENEPTYKGAIKVLSTKKIMAPCYLTMVGLNADEGALVTRKRKGEIKRLTLLNQGQTSHDADAVVAKQRRFIIQTNICHWNDEAWYNNNPKWAGGDHLLENALERREVATKNLNKFSCPPELSGSSYDDNFVNFSFEMLSKYPTCNGETIYQNVMHPQTNLYRTRIVHDPPTMYQDEGTAKGYHSDDLEKARLLNSP
ncbi:acid ceramidase [Acrasis kona]|uniref:Acid ceramidase n=1 Tax=Acrasis kona TaxID=1008807 RepID=A0AAW2YGS5_9EUKA